MDHATAIHLARAGKLFREAFPGLEEARDALFRGLEASRSNPSTLPPATSVALTCCAARTQVLLCELLDHWHALNTLFKEAAGAAEHFDPRAA